MQELVGGIKLFVTNVAIEQSVIDIPIDSRAVMDLRKLAYAPSPGGGRKSKPSSLCGSYTLKGPGHRAFNHTRSLTLSFTSID